LNAGCRATAFAVHRPLTVVAASGKPVAASGQFEMATDNDGYVGIDERSVVKVWATPTPGLTATAELLLFLRLVEKPRQVGGCFGLAAA
jgi:hypothetical protein